MDCSFTSDGKFFVFSTATGKTIRAGFPNKAAALAWMAIAAKKAQPIPV